MVINITYQLSRQGKITIYKYSIFIFFLSLLILAVNIDPAGATPKYTGTNGCTCHKNHITEWSLSIHGRAFETLKPGKKKEAKLNLKLDPYKNYSEDRKCQRCHTTGYRQDGGFIDTVSTPGMINVGCESCHGPGDQYRRLHDDKAESFTRQEAKSMGAVYGSEDPQVCKNCHNEERAHFDDNVKANYVFRWEEALKNEKSYHGVIKSGKRNVMVNKH